MAAEDDGRRGGPGTTFVRWRSSSFDAGDNREVGSTTAYPQGELSRRKGRLERLIRRLPDDPALRSLADAPDERLRCAEPAAYLAFAEDQLERRRARQTAPGKFELDSGKFEMGKAQEAGGAWKARCRDCEPTFGEPSSYGPPESESGVKARLRPAPRAVPAPMPPGEDR